MALSWGLTGRALLETASSWALNALQRQKQTKTCLQTDRLCSRNIYTCCRGVVLLCNIYIYLTFQYSKLPIQCNISIPWELWNRHCSPVPALVPALCSLIKDYESTIRWFRRSASEDIWQNLSLFFLDIIPLIVYKYQSPKDYHFGNPLTFYLISPSGHLSYTEPLVHTSEICCGGEILMVWWPLMANTSSVSHHSNNSTRSVLTFNRQIMIRFTDIHL